MRYGISDKSPFTSVTGKPQMSDVARDSVAQIAGGGKWEWLNREGTQSGSHPAKSQSKTMRPLASE